MAARQLGVLCEPCSFEITERRRELGELRLSRGAEHSRYFSLSTETWDGQIPQAEKKERTDHDTPLPCCYYWLYWLLGSSVQRLALRDGERSVFLVCKQRKVGVQSDVVDSILMLEQRCFHL